MRSTPICWQKPGPISSSSPISATASIISTCRPHWPAASPSPIRPGVLTEDTADMAMALILAVARRIPEGARIVPDGRLGRLVADLDAGAADYRQASGHRRHGPDRPGARPPRQGIRPVDPLSQPASRAGQDRAGARGDLLGIPRPDARPHGHRVGELPAHAGDLPPSVGASPETHEGRFHPGEHRARRGDRRDRRSPG